MAKLRRKFGAVRLSDVEVGKTYEVLRVYEKDPKFLEFLTGLGLHPGTKVRVHQREYDETMVLAVTGKGARVHLGKSATQRIWVRNAT
jgi:Fe2+ transport system protein FeoA